MTGRAEAAGRTSLQGQGVGPVLGRSGPQDDSMEATMSKGTNGNGKVIGETPWAYREQEGKRMERHYDLEDSGGRYLGKVVEGPEDKPDTLANGICNAVNGRARAQEHLDEAMRQVAWIKWLHKDGGADLPVSELSRLAGIEAEIIEAKKALGSGGLS